MADIEYDYAVVPTIGGFSESRKFIRGLMGPFGSGKSSGCIMEIVQWAARHGGVQIVERRAMPPLGHFSLIRFAKA